MKFGWRLPGLLVVVLLQAGVAWSAEPAKIEVGPPVTGEPCPDFTLQEIEHYKTKRASLGDFKGQWLVLDFWTTTCASCVASFPKINKLQQAFKGKIQFMLVGKTDDSYNKDIRSVYEMYRKKRQLDLAIAYNNDLFARWEIRSVPRVVIIDPQGTVRAVTDGRDMTEEKLQELLDGGNPQFFTHKNIPYTPEKLLLIDGNGGTEGDLLYGSMLANWNGGRQYVLGALSDALGENGQRFQATGLILDWLYNYAYFDKHDFNYGDPLYGKVAKRVIREVKDDTPFNYDFSQMKNLYSYSVSLPPPRNTVENAMQVLRQDLRDCFGYEATVETRPMPVLKLVARPGAERKLKTRKSGEKSSFTPAGFTMYDVPPERVLGVIWGYHQSQPPLIDATGFTENIDITVDAILTDLEDIRKALRKNGLDLVESMQPMKVIVIRDVAQQG